jgi:hypothetical protein
MLNRFEEIFAGFLNRDYNYALTNAELMFEIKVLRKCGNINDYIRYNRKGATLATNRKTRKKIFGLYENAIKHALIENEMREAGVL